MSYPKLRRTGILVLALLLTLVAFVPIGVYLQWLVPGDFPPLNVCISPSISVSVLVVALVAWHKSRTAPGMRVSRVCSQSEPPDYTHFRAWQTSLIWSMPIVAFVIYMFYTWFAVRNRYLIFLYFHDMGPGFDTTPFGRVTASRYWMSGLVASGAVMVPYIAIHLILGRLVNTFRAPAWWRVWVLCAIPLIIAIPAIVMTVNDPVLPLTNAAQVTAVTLIGLALAVMLGQVAAKRPVAYVLLMIDGFALACLLGSLIRFESFSRWMARRSMGFIYRHLALVAVGIVLLIMMTMLYYWWRRAEIPNAVMWFVAGLDVMYLFMPLYHHLFWCKDDGRWTDPDYFTYISDADNYFARSVLLQMGVWIAVVMLVLGVTRLRLWLSRRRTASCAG